MGVRMTFPQPKQAVAFYMLSSQLFYNVLSVEVMNVIIPVKDLAGALSMQ